MLRVPSVLHLSWFLTHLFTYVPFLLNAISYGTNFLFQVCSCLYKLVVRLPPPKPFPPLVVLQAVLGLGVVGARAELVHGRPDHRVGKVHLLLHAQLLAKERDLILAAELGKALLEKNEDLSKQNEKIAEEFSQKLEVGLKAFYSSRKVMSIPTILKLNLLF